jgi:hypothetical protein
MLACTSPCHDKKNGKHTKPDYAYQPNGIGKVRKCGGDVLFILRFTLRKAV